MNTRAAHEVIDHAQAVDADLILQVGDFGYWPRAEHRAGVEYLTLVDDALASAGLELWFVPGNHEDWPELARLPVGDDGRRAVGARIFELPVGYSWTWGSTRWLAVGGAPSVDKHFRTEGVDWFSEEEVTERQAAAIIDAGRADVVVAHDAPMGHRICASACSNTLLPRSAATGGPSKRSSVRMLTSNACGGFLTACRRPVGSTGTTTSGTRRPSKPLMQQCASRGWLWTAHHRTSSPCSSTHRGRSSHCHDAVM